MLFLCLSRDMPGFAAHELPFTAALNHFVIFRCPVYLVIGMMMPHMKLPSTTERNITIL